MVLTKRAPTKTWVAREGTVYIASGVTFTTAQTLSGAYSTQLQGHDVSSACKNITITPPETSWEKQDLLGKDTNTFQNQLLDEKPPGLAMITATLIVGEDETIEDLVVSGSMATSASPTGYVRRQLGNDKSSINRATICVVLESNNGANAVSFGIEKGRVTKWGDVRISGPDSHWEQDITVIGLAKDFYYEFRD